MEVNAVGVRQLTVLGEFKPFGLIAEALEGKPVAATTALDDKCYYFLCESEVTRERDAGSIAPDWDEYCGGGEHEIFIRGNRLIWSSGSRVHKRFSLPSPIIMACWCRMDDMLDSFLCMLQEGTLSIHNSSGELISIPIPYNVLSIWPLPFGLLLQKANDGIHSSRFLPSSSSLRGVHNVRELSRWDRDPGSSHSASHQWNSYEHSVKDDLCTISSHLILKHPLEEPQAIVYKERGKLNIMKDFDERIIWSSTIFPLVASYHKGKAKHSIWVVEVAISDSEFETNIKLNGNLQTANQFVSKQYSFRRVWQGKCSHFPANKLFLASDDDGVTIVCFLLHDQKSLFSIRLRINDRSDANSFIVEPDLSWSIPAIDAVPVDTTRPRAKSGIQSRDILVLTPDNKLLLYSGKQCVCKYTLPIGFVNHTISARSESSMTNNLRVSKVADAVQGRINLVLNDDKILRCILHRSPSSSLVEDCIKAMSEGLHPTFYNKFCIHLWGNDESSQLSLIDTSVDSEWSHFFDVIKGICKQYSSTHERPSQSSNDTSWSFLLNSKFHIDYCRHTSFPFFSVKKRTVLDCSYPSMSYMVDEQNENKAFYGQFLIEALDALHALYESLKLDNLRKRDLELLVTLLCVIAASLHEANYMDHYIRDFPYMALECNSLDLTVPSRSTPSILRWIECSLKQGHVADTTNLPPLLCKERCTAVNWARKIIAFYSILLGAERTGNKLSSGVYCDIAKGSADTVEELTVLAMVAEGFGLQQLDLLPSGVSLPLRHVLDKCRESPPDDWPASAYVLIGRRDLALSLLGPPDKFKDQDSEMIKNLLGISTPYILRLQPVTVPFSISDDTHLDTVKVEDVDSFNSTSEDGMEHVINSTTQLRYGRDLRLNEVRRLLSSARSVPIQTSANSSASEQELQQHQLWNLAQRTTALPLGRGAFTLATTYTLLTETLVVPKLVLAGRLPAQQNATVNLDPNIRNISDLRSWPEFHNGVAAGLRLAPFQGKVSRTWILYNKPEEPNFTHAGLLLALGLHGHLRVLTPTDMYRHLSQEHDNTTIGFLLGIAASYRGTMDPMVLKLLNIHIPSRHPPSFPEMEVATIVQIVYYLHLTYITKILRLNGSGANRFQSAALVGLGLLYEGSAHPLTMKILMSEIGRQSGGDNVLEKEGYAVASGFALGLVGLGRGQDAFGFTDSFVDRLLEYTNGKETYKEKYSRLGSVIEENNRVGQMLDGTQINVDVTSPGATIALALIYLKTESEIMAARLPIPATNYDLQFVRPDFIMLRIIARNLIMWRRILASKEWVEEHIPEIIKTGLSKINDENSDSDDLDVEALVLAYVNIVVGACVSIGLKFAGTRNADAQELLHNYALYFLNEMKSVGGTSCKLLPKGLLQHIERNTLETCLHLIVLSLAVVMAGSGHLETFRLLRYLRNRNSADGQFCYGFQMTVSLAMGFLFLGGGLQTFSTGNSAIAALLFTLYPRLPTGPNDNRCHLQAFRHFYVIAAESRWIQTIDVDTGLPVYAPLQVTISETVNYAETSYSEVTPCILPERAVLKSVRVCGPRYWSQVIQLMPEDKPWWKYGDRNDPFNGGLIYIKRKVGTCSYVDDPTGCQSLLSRALHKVSDMPSMGSANVDTLVNSRFSKIDQLVGTFSSDPSLTAFARLCCDSSWENRSNVSFQDFCSQVLFDCVSKDQAALLQVYISLYTNVELMWEQVKCGHSTFQDSLFLQSLKIIIAYNDAVVSGKLKTIGQGIIGPVFVESLKKRIEEVLGNLQKLEIHLLDYLNSGKWPIETDCTGVLLSWYLLWYEIPSDSTVRCALRKIKPKIQIASIIPFLHLLLPRTHIKAITVIDKLSLSMHV